MAMNLEMLRFVHEDMEIRDPTISECGRFTVLPSTYGFTALPEGGWQLEIEGGDVLQLEGTNYSRISAGKVIAQADLSEVEMAE